MYRPVLAAQSQAVSESGGWNLIPAPPAFERHGYSAPDPYFNELSESVLAHDPTGMLHPNEAGHTTLRDALLTPLEPTLLPHGLPRDP